MASNPLIDEIKTPDDYLLYTSRVNDSFIDNTEHINKKIARRLSSFIKSSDVGNGSLFSQTLNWEAAQAKALLSFDTPPSTLFDSAKNIKIGITVPSIPPTNVRVEEVKNTTEVESLRTNTTLQMKTGRGAIRITLDMVFSTDREVNTELFEIIAQFRTSPFLTIESDYVYSAVYGGRAIEDTSDISDNVYRLRSDIDNLTKTIGKLYTQIQNAFTHATFNTSQEMEDMIDAIPNQPPQKLIYYLTDISSRIPKLLLNAEDSVGLSDAFKLANSLVQTVSIRDSSRKKLDSIVRMKPALLSPHYILPIIPVCLQDIDVSTDPNLIRGARATLTLLVFNHYPFSPHFNYRNGAGGPTADIDKCPSWRWYVKNRASIYKMKQYTPQFLSPLSITYEVGIETLPSDFEESVYNNSAITDIIMADSRVHKSNPSIDTHLSMGAEDVSNTIIVNSLAFSIRNIVAFQPVLSGRYPSMQCMGHAPSSVTMELIVPDNRLAEINYMKRALDNLSFNPFSRRVRDNFITIVGLDSTVLSLLGIENFQISTISTQSFSTTHSRVEIEMTGFENKTADELNLDAEKSGFTSKERLVKKLQVLYELSESYRIRQTDIGTKEYQAFKYLYGTDQNTPNGIISVEVLQELGKTDIDLFKEAVSGELLNTQFTTLNKEKVLLNSASSGQGGESLANVIQAVTTDTSADNNLSNGYKRIITKWQNVNDLGVGQDRISKIANILFDSIDEDNGSNRFIVSKVLLLSIDALTSTGNKELVEHLENVVHINNYPPKEVFPDLKLPTYGTLIHSFLEAGGVLPASRVSDIDLETLPLSATRIIAERFGAPTYREQGIIDIDDSIKDRIAVSLDDYVDPDFYFHRPTQFRAILDTGVATATEVTAKFLSAFGADPQLGSVTRLKNAADAGKQIYEDKRSGLLVPDDLKNASTLGVLMDPDKSAIDMAIPDARGHASSIQLANNFTGEKVTNNLLAKFKSHIAYLKDDVYRMNRAFPAFQLYFIEEDNEQLLLLNKWYGFNAVIEANVTRHKWEPDVAEISLVNIMGTLDDEGFRSTTNRKDDVENPESRNQPRDLFTGKLRADLRKKFPIQEGTRIVLKMGYGSTEDYLETVFTGKIVEINKGDVITLLAQGFGAELTAPIQESNFSLNGFWSLGWDKLFGIARRPGILSLIVQTLDSQPAENFGAWGLNNIFNAFLHSGADTRNPNQAPDVSKGLFLASPTQILQKIGGSIAGGDLDEQARRSLAADPRLLNIFTEIPFQNHLLKSKTDTTLDDEEFQSSWVVGDKTGLQVLKELNLHHPDYIFSVIPFDGRATLFYGRPNDTFYYTDKYVRGQVMAQMTDRTNLERISQVTESMGPNDISQVILGFVNSNDFNLFTTFVEKAEEARGILPHRLKTETNPENKRFLQVIQNIITEDKQIGPTVNAEFINLLQSRPLVETLIKASLSENLVGNPSIFGQPGGHLELNTAAGIDLDTDGVRRMQTSNNFVPFWNEIDGSWKPYEIPDGEGFIDTVENLGRTFGYIASSGEDWKVIFLRRYIICFFNYLKTKGLSDLPKSLQAVSVAHLSQPSLYKRGQRTFRNYHFVDSVHHIIRNDIVATRAEMHNVVHLHCKGGETRMASLDDDIVLADISPIVRQAPNAESARQQVVGSYAALAEEIRPMYRGELVIRGNERIKPHDLVYMLDMYNGIFGVVEVERVIHHFTRENGFTTTIIPHLHCTALDTATWWETTGFNITMGATALGIATLGTVTGAVASTVAGAALGPGALVSGVVGTVASAAASFKLVNEVVELESGGASILGCLFGSGNFGRAQNPVTIFPLLIRGDPWVAGIRGFNPGNFNFLDFYFPYKATSFNKSEILKSWKRLSRGWTRLKDVATAAFAIKGLKGF